MNLGRSDKPIQCNALWFFLGLQICAYLLERKKKNQSSAIGVLNEVCSWALVGSLTEPQNKAILFPSLRRGQGSKTAVNQIIFLPVRNTHAEATSLYSAAVKHF